MHWIDTHCHLDAPEFDPDRAAVIQRARAAGVGLQVLPAVMRGNWASVQALARAEGLAYALGIHPLYVDRAEDDDLDRLDQALAEARDDPRLVAVGEIGLDFFVPGLDPQRQERFYLAQLKLARRHGLPVILHVRRSADGLLKGLRRHAVDGGIAHAFNGSPVQAQAFVERGFALGFGGAMAFERALNIRRLASQLPADALVLETDAPDIPPPWRYQTAAMRAAMGRALAARPGEAVAAQDERDGRNEPAELPRIADTLAQLRGWPLAEVAARTAANAQRVLPRLVPLVAAAPAGPARSAVPQAGAA